MLKDEGRRLASVEEADDFPIYACGRAYSLRRVIMGIREAVLASEINGKSFADIETPSAGSTASSPTSTTKSACTRCFGYRHPLSSRPPWRKAKHDDASPTVTEIIVSHLRGAVQHCHRISNRRLAVIGRAEALLRRHLGRWERTTSRTCPVGRIVVLGGGTGSPDTERQYLGTEILMG